MGKKWFGYGDFYCWNCGKNIEKGHDNCPFCGRCGCVILKAK